MSLIKILFSTWWNSCTINIDLTSCKREGGNLRGKKKHKKPQEKAITRKTKKKKKRKKGTTREGGGWHSSLCSLPPPPFIDFLSSSSSPVTKNRQSKPSMAFLFLSGLIPRSPPHQTWPPLSAEQTSPTINSIASNWELHPQRWLQSRLAATSSTAPATRCKCKPTAAIEGTLLSFPSRLKQQPPASVTPLYFQQQPSLLISGSMNFSDLSSSHREQQQH